MSRQTRSKGKKAPDTRTESQQASQVTTNKVKGRGTRSHGHSVRDPCRVSAQSGDNDVCTVSLVLSIILLIFCYRHSHLI